MKNTNILIGAGVVIAGYLLWKKLQPKEKTCVKWSENQCVRSPCTQTCEEYK
jgi:hypothetical protein